MERRLPPGWRATELLPNDPKIKSHVREVESIAKALAAIPKMKRDVPTHWNGKPIADLSSSEKEEFYLSQQPESTKTALIAQKSRKLEDDENNFLRPLPLEDEWKRDPDIRREITPDEFMLYKGVQRAEKNTIGQTLKGSVDLEKREKGIEAFTYSKPANPSDADLKRLKELSPIKAVTPSEPEEVEAPRQRTWWKFWEPRGMTDEEWDAFKRGQF